MEKDNDKLSPINAYRPIENASDKPTFKFFLIEVSVYCGDNVVKKFKRNVAMFNPIHAIDLALRDIKKRNAGIIFDNIVLNVSPRYTKEPSYVAFDPDNPED